MSVGPRLHVTRFHEVSTKSVQWSQHVARAVGRPTITTSTGPAFYVWQLFTGNGRRLALSAPGFADLDEVTSHGRRTVERAAELELVLTTDPDTATHGWYLTLDGQPAAVCARWYGTERDQRQSSELALVMLAAAQVGSTPSVIRSMPRSASRHATV